MTIEKGDKGDSNARGLLEEIEKMSEEVNTKNIVLLPFAPLSSDIADSERCIYYFNKLGEELGKSFDVIRGHFGSHEELLLNLFGHPGNARFREF